MITQSKIKRMANEAIDRKFKRRSSRKKHRRKVISIMNWNPDSLGVQRLFNHGDFNRCGHFFYHCTYTSDQMAFNTSDVVIVDAFYVSLDRFPKYRPAQQRWLFNGYEAPVRMWPEHYGYYDDQYNLTIAFTPDSDVFTPFGLCYDAESPAASQNHYVRKIYGDSDDIRYRSLVSSYLSANPVPSISQLSKKSLIALWTPNECRTQSAREIYIYRLSKWVDIHIYSACKFHKSRVKHLTREEFRMMRAKYRFYLAFENSLCEDYVTEKLFKIFSLNIVPVVLGNVDYASILPPHSYIDVRDYGSARDLGRYLNYLSTNSTAYAEYFAWKKRYVCFNGVPILSTACRLCQFLNTNYGVKTKVKSISEFWSRKRRCKTPDMFYRDLI